MIRKANISLCRQYRYSLTRIWDKSLPRIMFVGLNPSKANEHDDDPTIRKVMGFARLWGYGGIYMVNCFAYRATNPVNLKGHYFSNRNSNIREIEKLSLKIEEVVFAWGSFDVVREMKMDIVFKQLFNEPKCLIKNKDNSPRHPLYISYKQSLIPY